MTDRFISIIALIAVVAATVIYANTTLCREAPMDRVKAALADLVHATDPGSDITLQLFNVDEDVPYQVRYLLAPRYMAPPVFKNDTALVMKQVNGQQVQMYRIVKKLKYDTALSICRVGAPDSIVHVIIDKRKVLWQNKDDVYRYYLTASH